MPRRYDWGIATMGAVMLAPDGAWAQGLGESWRFNCGPHMMGWAGGWAGMIVMPLFMVAAFVVLLAFVVALVRWLTGASRTPQSGAALDILRERFARGEIDKQEFDERRRVLGG